MFSPDILLPHYLDSAFANPNAHAPPFSKTNQTTSSYSPGSGDPSPLVVLKQKIKQTKKVGKIQSRMCSWKELTIKRATPAIHSHPFTGITLHLEDNIHSEVGWQQTGHTEFICSGGPLSGHQGLCLSSPAWGPGPGHSCVTWKGGGILRTTFCLAQPI